jgi:ABC-type sugar transport systems, ATPase components
MQPLPIGETDIIKDNFTIPSEARRKHMAIFGKSGTGKSTLLRNMIAFEIKQDIGATVLDPHGDLIDGILEMIPKEQTILLLQLSGRKPSFRNKYFRANQKRAPIAVIPKLLASWIL